MEIRARYTLIGSFTLAVIAAGFLFVYWLNGSGTFRHGTRYQIRFENTVSGLLPGSAVLFNGVRVGERGKIVDQAAQGRSIVGYERIDVAERIARGDCHALPGIGIGNERRQAARTGRRRRARRPARERDRG